MLFIRFIGVDESNKQKIYVTDLKFKLYFLSGALGFDNENEISETERESTNRYNANPDFFHIETKSLYAVEI